MEERYQALLTGTEERPGRGLLPTWAWMPISSTRSHEFKNLAFQTTMNVSGLGNISGSMKSTSSSKCRYLQRQHEGRGVYL